MTADIDLSLTAEQAAGILQVSASDVRVGFLRPANHMWRIEAGGGRFYLKAHTKPWYGGKPCGDVVRHEVSAYRMLAEHGLATPEIVSSSLTCENPLRWPYLLLRELDGTALTDLLPALEPSERDEVLRCVGAYLAGMHAIQFEHPGYINDGPPATPPDPERWQHPIWRFERCLRQAFATWTDDAAEVDGATMDAVAALLADHAERLRATYEPPRFVHGDCHASQFFLSRIPSTVGDSGWRVTGVVDLEVASSGSPMSDFLKLVIELAGHFGVRSMRWWEPILEAYGEPVDFDVLRLYLAIAGHINYSCLGPHSWPGTRAEILRHLVRSRTWDELLDLERIAA